MKATRFASANRDGIVGRAFETMIVDVCKAMLRLEPRRLKSERFSKMKLTADTLLLDRADQLDLVVDLAFNAQSEFRDAGIGKLESQLGQVELSGDVTDDIAKCINEIKRSAKHIPT